MIINICNTKVFVSFHDTDLRSATLQELNSLATMTTHTFAHKVTVSLLYDIKCSGFKRSISNNMCLNITYL